MTNKPLSLLFLFFPPSIAGYFLYRPHQEGGVEEDFLNLSRTKELAGRGSRRMIREKVRIILNFGKSDAAAAPATGAIAASAFRVENRISNCFFSLVGIIAVLVVTLRPF